MFLPIHAYSRTYLQTVEPRARDDVQLSFVRSGEAELLGALGGQRISTGDVLVLGPSIVCGSKPIDHLTLTSLLLDPRYLVDLVFWQYVDEIGDRDRAVDFAGNMFTDPFQILRIGEQRAGLLIPWLDELTALCVNGTTRERFHRAQALWFSIADVIVPFISVSATQVLKSQRAGSWPLSHHSPLQEVRAEARNTAALLHREMARKWSLEELANRVHLSSSQLGRVFSKAYGKPPIAYLMMLRVERMATLLRAGDEPISRIATQVGWSDPDHATRQFRRHVGISPTMYRSRLRMPVPSEDPLHFSV